jgi:hypothetical protein
VVATVGLGADPVGHGSARGVERVDGVGDRRDLRRQSVSTSASSSAIAAPWAMFGEVACAASPISTTRSRAQRSRATSSIVETCMSAAASSASSSVAAGSANSANSSSSRSGGRARVCREPGSRQRRSSSARSRRRLGSSETPSGVQHYRPCRDLGGSRREEAPADLDPRAGHCPGLKRQPAHGAVYPVRPDDEIVFAARPVAELDSDDAVALGEALHSQPDSDGSSRAASRRSLCSSDRCSARHARRLPRARLRRPRTAACRGGRRSAGA